MYKEDNFLVMQNELEVVFSIMTDQELMRVRTAFEGLINERVYEEKGFPLSCGGLRFLIATIMFSFWVRKEKGVRIEGGEIVVCPLEESPFWQRYQTKPTIDVEEVYDNESPDHERDQTIEVKDEERGEFI